MAGRKVSIIYYPDWQWVSRIGEIFHIRSFQLAAQRGTLLQANCNTELRPYPRNKAGDLNTEDLTAGKTIHVYSCRLHPAAKVQLTFFRSHVGYRSPPHSHRFHSC